MSPRFEVDYKQRLEQRKNASNAVRLPRMGYELYRVYVIEEKKESVGMKPGPINATMIGSKSRQSGKSQANWQQILWAVIDELETKIEPAYEVKWLKTKQATLLRLKGHRVEPTTADDKSNIKPIRIGT